MHHPQFAGDFFIKKTEFDQKFDGNNELLKIIKTFRSHPIQPNFPKHESFFKQHSLFATGTTGLKIMENTDLKVHRCLSGPYGGDQQIGNLVALGQMDMVIFFRDPLTAQPHEPDINALMRLCDVHYVPLASNKATAIMLLKSVK